MGRAAKLIELLAEAKGPKPSFGDSEGVSYAVNLPNLGSNEFYKQPFGRKIEDMRKVKLFQKSAKKDHVNAKGKPIMAAVKAWVKMMQPKEFYASWKKESSMYKDDSVEIFYTK
jgi:hypothetical protein